LNIIVITSFSYIAYGQQYGWRGPGRTGIYNETGLMKVWPSSGPALLWDATGIGKGYSSTTVTDDAVYITGIHGEKDVLTAFTQDGKKKWEVEYGNMSKVSSSPESRCTPTYSNGKLFVISGQGDLACVTRDGKIAWSLNYYQKYSAEIQRFGISESPLVVDNKVIATPGGNKASMVAFNLENGNVVWEAPPLNEGTQYTNPLLVENKGMKVIVTHTATYIIGVNVANGKREKLEIISSFKVTKGDGQYWAHPVIDKGRLFVRHGDYLAVYSLKAK
jgi:outer membrane protein assembly factor BamB